MPGKESHKYMIFITQLMSSPNNTCFQFKRLSYIAEYYLVMI